MVFNADHFGPTIQLKVSAWQGNIDELVRTQSEDTIDQELVSTIQWMVSFGTIFYSSCRDLISDSIDIVVSVILDQSQ